MNKIYNIIALIFFLSSSYVYGVDLEVDVLNSNYIPASILIDNFYATPKASKYVDKIQNIISQDLEESGAMEVRFANSKLINQYTNFKDTKNLQIKIKAYKRYHGIVVGQITYNQLKQSYHIIVMIFDNLGGVQHKFAYKLSANELKQSYTYIAHDIANEIYSNIIALPGYFTSSLVYAAGNKLMLADYNGKNAEVLVKVKEKIMSPNIAPDGNSILYTEFYQGTSYIYIYDLYFKRNIKLATFQGLSLSPVFSQDGSSIIFAIANQGVTHIFRLNIKTKDIVKITKGYSINLPGNESRDGQYLIFNSDKSIQPAIYVLSNATNKTSLVSYGNGSYFTPSFSPTSNIILFTKIVNRQFAIGLLNLAHKEKLVTKDLLVESPSWLPDGRHIIYQYAYMRNRSQSKYSFFIMDLMSGYKIQVLPNSDVQDPQISKTTLSMRRAVAKYTF